MKTKFMVFHLVQEDKTVLIPTLEINGIQIVLFHNDFFPSVEEPEHRISAHEL